MKATVALLSLCCWVNAVVPAAHTGPKCGVGQMWSPMVQSLRVVGGTEATYGSHPWLVSLRLKNVHFCGGAVLTQRWVMTAAHCFTTLSREFLRGVSVAVGEFDLRVEDEEEQVFGVETVTVHEKYHHASPMTYDIALVELDRHVRLGVRVQPLCLPLPDENVPPHTSCIVGGWGRIKERGRLPAVLREVRLDLVDPAKCNHVLKTVRSSGLNQRPVRPQAAVTVLCAGPERGGKDACQGDSGGPLVCLTGSGGGHWVALGVTSWGKGCGRSWGNNSSRPPARRGSPGIFTDVRLLLPWIKLKLREADQRKQGNTLSGLCSVRDGSVHDRDGVIRNPASPGDRYGNNELCVWKIPAPPGRSLVVEFEHFDLENDLYCRYDRLTISVEAQRPVGVFCGGVSISSVLLSPSQSATLRFSSDVSRAGRGFVIRHRAVQESPGPECGMLALIEDQTVVHSPNYPQSYSNDCVLHWVIHAPRGHIVKLDFADLDLEESHACLYDSLTVLGDVELTEEIAVLCGRSVPPPVLSYHDVMVLRFSSDSSVTHRGFRASLTFISHADLHHDDHRPGKGQRGHQDHVKADQWHAGSHDQESRIRTRSYQGDVGQEDPRLDMDTSSDDEESSGESSSSVP